MKDLVDSTGKPLPLSEAPSEDTLRAYGDAAFLYMRSPRHQDMPLKSFRESVEPPLILGQYRIFGFDGVPRGMFTWAWMSPEAEREYVCGGALRPEDWRSGDRLWIIDLVAPYRGLTSGIGRWIMTPGNLTETEFLFRRVVGANGTRRIVHVRLDRPHDKARILSEADFA